MPNQAEFKWQLTREKLPAGRVNDWPEQGICSTPCVEGKRMWVVTNRCELMCVDMEGFHDGENDGPYKEEADHEKADADIIWSLDMIEELRRLSSQPRHQFAADLRGQHLHPHIQRRGRGPPGDPVASRTLFPVRERRIRARWFGRTTRRSTPSCTASGLAGPGRGGRQGTGLHAGRRRAGLYALDAKTGEHVWKFDLNPKDSKWELGGRGTRKAIISTPVFVENSVLLAVGQDPEHGEGVGHLYRIDASKKGDVSTVTPDGKPNPNSAEIWHYGGEDKDGNELFRRTISTVAVSAGLVYAPDLSGRLHCVDFKTGKRHWEADVLAAIWGSPMVVDGKVLMGDEGRHPDRVPRRTAAQGAAEDRVRVVDLQHAHHRRWRDVRFRPLANLRLPGEIADLQS